jgi:S1-C subfamily serine protease
MLEAADLPVQTGVLLSSVEPGSPAYRAGLCGGGRQITVSGVLMLAGGDIVIAIDTVSKLNAYGSGYEAQTDSSPQCTAKKPPRDGAITPGAIQTITKRL